MLFGVKYPSCQPLLDVLPVLFDWVKFWTVWWQADHFNVIFSDVLEYFFGKVPSCIVDNDAQLLVVLMQSFKKCKILFSVDFWAQLCYNLTKAERSKCVNLL